MRPAPAVAAALAALASAGILVLVLPGRAAVVGHGLLVVLLGLAFAIALDRLRRALPVRRSAFDASFVQGEPSRARPATLERAEREVTLATGTAFDVHFRLRPMLRSIASGLLLRRGIDLERSPGRASALLGPEVWEVVRPDRPAPQDRSAPGLAADRLERAVDDLERLACS